MVVDATEDVEVGIIVVIVVVLVVVVDDVVVVVVDETLVDVDERVLVVVVAAPLEQLMRYTFTPSLTMLESLVNLNFMLVTLFNGPMLLFPSAPLP
jgi:hypothetical protein